MRPDGRTCDALRPVSIQRGYSRAAEGSALISFGETVVLCTATIDDQQPPFLRNTSTGWVTAEYAMLPRSAGERVARDHAKKGRALEISRLIGRSLRCVMDLDVLGPRQVILDCDVLNADGGTRTAAITGAYVALHDALQWLRERSHLSAWPLIRQCAAVSVGLVEGEARLDLCYEEDAAADVDLNLVMSSDNQIIEVQGCAEGDAFPRSSLNTMLDLAENGISRLFQAQREVLGLA